MRLDRLEQRVMRDEGYRSSAYLCTAGVWTVGYGSTRIYGVPVKELDTTNKYAARVQLRADLYQCILDCHKLFETWDDIDDVRKEVLVNMMYNLGPTRLGGFRNMRSAIHAKAWQRASEEMVDSKWYSQVGARAQRLAAAMRTGQWIEDSI